MESLVKVWILKRNIPYEGFIIEGVYSTEEKAEQAYLDTVEKDKKEQFSSLSSLTIEDFQLE